MTLMWDDNLSRPRKTFVTHLECSMSGERHEADRLHGLSDAGWPLLVRYDLEGVRRSLTRETIAERPMDLWRYRELLPVRRAGNLASLGETATTLRALAATGKRLGLNTMVVTDRARSPTGFFQDSEGRRGGK